MAMLNNQMVINGNLLRICRISQQWEWHVLQVAKRLLWNFPKNCPFSSMMKPACWNYSNWWGSIANCWLLKDENSHDLPSYPPLRFSKILQLSGQPDPVPTLTMRSTKEPPWGAPALVVRVWMPRVCAFHGKNLGCFLMRILRSRSK